jgi:hypothetical protein
MHSLISQFLDFKRALDVLQRDPRSPDEQAYAQAANELPVFKKAVLAAKHKKSAPPQVQEQLVVLAAHAAAGQMLKHETLGPKAQAVIDAFIKSGEAADEARTLITQMMLEEAFGFGEDVDHFDADFMSESLDSMVALAATSQDTVDDLIEVFAKADAVTKPQRIAVADAILKSHWENGPFLFSADATDDALQELLTAETEESHKSILALAEEFLQLLATRNYIGKERLKRLLFVVRNIEFYSDGDDEEFGDEDNENENES